MKKLFTLALVFIIAEGTQAQTLKDVFGRIAKRDSTGQTSLGKVLNSMSNGDKSSLSTSTIVSGLKQALEVGTERSVTKLSTFDGFFKDAALKIIMPQEAQNVEQKLRAIGFGKQVDNAILAMNRAAEDASKKAAPIFINAIKGMSINDAVGILKGGDFAATTYLKGKTTSQLTEAFRPIIESSLAKVNATRYWNTLFATYNQFSANKVNPDLSAYVTEKALSGIFVQVGLEEQKIRKDPVARTTDILKQVFGAK